MARLEIPSANGHDVIEFDKTTDAGVKEAMAKFEELVKEQKHAAFTKNPGDAEPHHIKSFDETQERTTFLLPRQGG